MAAATDLYLPDECCSWTVTATATTTTTATWSLSPSSQNSFSQSPIVSNYHSWSVTPHSLSSVNSSKGSPNLTLMSYHCFLQLTQTNNNSISLMDFVVCPNLKIKYLHFSGNYWLRTQHFKMFSSIFPNLQLLDLSFCYYISIEDICEFVKNKSWWWHIVRDLKELS